MGLNIKKGRQKTPRRTLVYGTPGVGKSTFAAGAVNPLFIPVEDGIDDIDVDRVNKIVDVDQMMQVLRDVVSDEHDYKTLVIDSLSALETLIHAKVCKKYDVDSIEVAGGGYGKGYVEALNDFIGILNALEYIRVEKDMNIVLIAHDTVELDPSPSTNSFQKYYPRLHKRARQKITEWCDEVLFAYFQVFTAQEDQGFSKKVTKAKGSQRMLLCDGAKGWAKAKNRLGMPEQVEMSWQEYQKFIDGVNANG